MPAIPSWWLYAMVVLANNLYISLTVQLTSTAVTTFELHIDKKVDNDNILYKWYERSMVRTVPGTNSLWYEIQIVNGTKSPDTDILAHGKINVSNSNFPKKFVVM